MALTIIKLEEILGVVEMYVRMVGNRYIHGDPIQTHQ